MKELYLVHHSKGVRRTEKSNGTFEAPKRLVAEEASTISVAGGAMGRGGMIRAQRAQFQWELKLQRQGSRQMPPKADVKVEKCAGLFLAFPPYPSASH